MTGQDGGFSQAARRFIAEVDTALTRARRAAREARAVSEEFRRSTGELGAQAKTGKLRGLRRSEVTPTTETSRAEAVEFRTANGLPVEDLPGADSLTGRPEQRPPVAREPDDFSQHRVLFDVDGPGEPVETGPPQPSSASSSLDLGEDRGDDTGAGDRTEFGRAGTGNVDRIDSPAGGQAPASDDDEDFSQQRILLDATVESYRPDDMAGLVFDPLEPKNTRSDVSPDRRPDTAD